MRIFEILFFCFVMIPLSQLESRVLGKTRDVSVGKEGKRDLRGIRARELSSEAKELNGRCLQRSEQVLPFFRTRVVFNVVRWTNGFPRALANSYACT